MEIFKKYGFDLSILVKRINFFEKNKSEDKVSDKAFEYIKQNKKKLIKKYFSEKTPMPKEQTSLAIFMAGSPGAGKTEFSENFLDILSPELKKTFVRIDADEIREFLPKNLYNGKNSDEVQRAAVKGVEILFDYASKKNFNFILDGTFTNLGVCMKNMKRMISKPYRNIRIFFIYQEPLTAWEFTKQREALDGRRVYKKNFIKAFFESQKNVDFIKAEFPSITVDLAIKNLNHVGLEKYYINVKSIEKLLEKGYNEKNLLDKKRKI